METISTYTQSRPQPVRTYQPPAGRRYVQETEHYRISLPLIPIICHWIPGRLLNPICSLKYRLMSPNLHLDTFMCFLFLDFVPDLNFCFQPFSSDHLNLNSTPPTPPSSHFLLLHEPSSRSHFISLIHLHHIVFIFALLFRHGIHPTIPPVSALHGRYS